MGGQIPHGNHPLGERPHFWLLNLMRRTRLIHLLLTPLGALLAKTARLKLSLPARPLRRGNSAQRQRRSRTIDRCWSAIVILLTLAIAWRVILYVQTGVTLNDVGHVMVLGLITLLRVAVLIALSSLIWVPLGVLIGLRPTLAGKIQPIAQFLAAFPANLLFPVFVITIVHFRLNPDIWLSPLIVLGTSGTFCSTWWPAPRRCPTTIARPPPIFTFAVGNGGAR